MKVIVGELYRIANADETDIPDAFYEKVALWSEPDTWGSLITFLLPNEIVLVIEMNEDGYARVMRGDLIGYLHEDYLKKVLDT